MALVPLRIGKCDFGAHYHCASLIKDLSAQRCAGLLRSHCKATHPQSKAQKEVPLGELLYRVHIIFLPHLLPSRPRIYKGDLRVGTIGFEVTRLDGCELSTGGDIGTFRAPWFTSGGRASADQGNPSEVIPGGKPGIGSCDALLCCVRPCN